MADQRLNLAMVLDRFIEEQAAQEDEERRGRYGTENGRRDHFYFSESGGGVRKIFYDMVGGVPTDPTDARSSRVFENGEWIQLRYEQYLRMLGLFVAREIRVSTYDKDPETGEILTMAGLVAGSGRMDVVIDAKRLQALYDYYFMGGDFNAVPEPLVGMEAIELEPGFTYYVPAERLTLEQLFAIEEAEPGRLGIVEMKSASTYSFGDIVKTAAPKPEHRGQAGWYQYLTGITHAWVMYEDKNDQKLEAFYQERDEQMIVGNAKSPGYNTHFETVKSYIDAGQVPPRCDGAGDGKKFPCQWKSGRCKYFEFCWSAEHGGEVIPGYNDGTAPAEDDISVEEIKGWLDEYEGTDFWVKMIDANGNGNVVVATMPKVLRDQMLDYLYPNSVEVEWMGMHDTDETSDAEVVNSQPPERTTEDMAHDVVMGLRNAILEENPIGTHCSICKEPQYNTPSGVTCKQGHGDALSAEEVAEIAKAEAAKAQHVKQSGPPRIGQPKPKEPVIPNVIKVTYQDLTAPAGTDMHVEDMTHEQYVKLCEAEGKDLVQIVDAEELLPGYFDKLNEGADPTVLWTANDFQSAALSAKSTSSSVKQSEGVAVEQVASDGQKYIFCAFANCSHGDPIEFKRLGNGGVIKCPGCKQNNKVVRPEG